MVLPALLHGCRPGSMLLTAVGFEQGLDPNSRKKVTVPDRGISFKQPRGDPHSPSTPQEPVRL